MANAAGINRSIVSRFLGKGSHIDSDPAIKIFNVVQTTLSIYEKRQLLDGFGLLSLAEAINPSFTNPDGFDLKQPRTGHYAGLELLMYANNIAKHSWEQARFAFEAAERAFGPLSGQAAHCACGAIRQSINLGEYGKALADIARVKQIYPMVLDIEAKATLEVTEGLVYFYNNDLASDQISFEQSLAVEKSVGVDRSNGFEGLCNTAPHYLGRICVINAQNARNETEKTKWLKQAQSHYDVSHRRAMHLQLDEMTGYELFRHAELHFAQNDPASSVELRGKVRQIFGRFHGVHHVDIHEADLALRDGRNDASKRLAHHALNCWIPAGYTRGVADALEILGTDKETSAYPEQALKLVACAWLIHPTKNDVKSNRLKAKVRELMRTVQLKPNNISVSVLHY